MSTLSIRTWRAIGVSLGVTVLLSWLGGFGLNHAVAATDQPQDALASILVNTTNPSIVSDGLCSLIEAIENANADAAVHADCAAGSGADTITLPLDAVMIFTTTHNLVDGGSALPIVTTTITVQGNGTTLVRDTNGTPNFRFFNVAASGSLTLNELNMRNGLVGSGTTTFLLEGGGAIINYGRVQVNNSNLSFNHASYGGAIYSLPVTGSLTVNNSTFSSNVADLLGGALYNVGPASLTGGLLRFNQAGNNGGAILNDSSVLTVTSASVMDNTSAGSGAGISARAVTTDSWIRLIGSSVISNAAALNGGGLYNTANNGLTSVVEVENSAITGNRTTATSAGNGLGGGIFNGWAEGAAGGSAVITVKTTSVLNNVAQVGGGIANLAATGYSTRTATIGIYQSTLARNVAAGTGSAQGSGGGLYNSNGFALLANSTVSSNQAVGDDTVLGGRGGGIGSAGRGITTTLQLLNVTVALNEATQAGGGIALVGVTTTVPAMDVGNTLVVSNALTVSQSISNAAVLATIDAPQVITGTESCSLENGTTNSLGSNIEDGSTCGFTAATDLQNTVVPLGPLANNGGNTLTHLITNEGPAYNSGSDGLCGGSPVNGVDQRGVARPFAGQCDRGAVELEENPPIVETYFMQIYLFHSFD